LDFGLIYVTTAEEKVGLMDSGDTTARVIARTQSWLTALAVELPQLQSNQHPMATVPGMLQECELWVLLVPADAWDRRANVESLLADVEAAMLDSGPRFRDFAGEPVDHLRNALRQLLPGSRADRHANISQLRERVDELASCVTSADARRAAWADLTEEACGTGADLAIVKRRTALLSALLDTAGTDPDAAFLRARMQLSPPPALIGRIPDTPAADATDDDRVRACGDIFAEPPRTGRCVAWLSYGDARLNYGPLQAGPVVFCDSDWAIPNALSTDGQDFLHRMELQNVLEHTSARRDHDSSKGRSYEVLARVDLGHRVTYRALDDAAAMVEVMIGVVVNRSNASAWHRTELSCLLVDGEVSALELGPPSPLPKFEPDHYGQNAAADAFATYAPELGELMSAGSLAPGLAEALRLIGEAGQLDSRDNSLNRSATIAEQTAVMLQAAAVEHIASFAGVSNQAHDEALRVGWPIARWNRDVRTTVERCLSGVGSGTDPVFQQVVTSGRSGRRISLAAAYRLRDQLTAACPGQLHWTCAARLLDSIGNPAVCAALLEEFEAEAVLLDNRLRRTRNALAHGNPVTIETVRSVREFSRFKADSALETAIHSVIHGRPLNDEIRQQVAKEADTRTKIDEGVSFHDMWSHGG
jgi:hypothetical protein